VTGVLAGLAPVAVPPASAAWQSSAASNTSAAPNTGSAAPSSEVQVYDELPVQVEVTRLEPRAPGADSVITVEGRLTNTGSEILGRLQVRLQSGERLASRSTLAAAAARSAQPPSATRAFSTGLELPGELAPGATRAFRYRAPVSDLELGAIGVYRLLVNVRGRPDREARRQIGAAATFLPWFPEPIPAPSRVAWLWPLVDVPRRAAEANVLLDDELAASLRDGGRLDGLLRAAEQARAGPQPIPLTLAVDPDLLDTVATMADGYVVATAGRRTAGTGAAPAAAWLARLRALAAGTPVLALPFADLDLVALAREGSGEEAVGAAVYGAEVVRRVLAVEPEPGLAWPPGGLLTDQVLDAEVERGVRNVVLSSASFAAGSQVTRSARSPLPAVGGTATAVVSDATLGALVTGLSRPGRLAEQRFLAEIAMITAEAPNRARDVVVAPARRFALAPETAQRLLADTAALPWAIPTSVPEIIARGELVPRGALRYPERARTDELDEAHLNAVDAVRGRVESLRGALTNDAAPLLTPYTRALWRAESSAWREEGDGAGFVAAVAQSVEGLRGQVRILTAGTLTLASATTPLRLTVANDLAAPVRVRLRLVGGAGAGFSTSDVGVTTIGARQIEMIAVPTRVQRSGTFTVRAFLLTPDGDPLGAPVQLRVHSTAYGRVAVAITGGALVVLLVAVAVRLARRLRARRRRARQVPATPRRASVGSGAGRR